MYLHLGQNVVVSETDIIGIFDIDNTTGSHITKEFLKEAEKAGNVIYVSDELPGSYIVSGTEGKNYVHISQLSPQTLLKRSESTRGYINKNVSDI